MLPPCGQCHAELSPGIKFCPNCGAETDFNPGTVSGSALNSGENHSAGDRAALGPSGTDATGAWGLAAPALGLMALIPSAILVSLLGLVLPLNATTVIAAVLLAMVQLALVWSLTTRSWPLQPALYGLKRPNMPWWRALISGAFMLGASLGGIQLYLMAVNWLGADYLVPPDLPHDLLLPGASVLLTVVALAVITPIAEEIFFRGFLMQGLVNRWGGALGIIASAAIFAGLHFQPLVIVPVFITGLLLGSLYWQTGVIVARHCGSRRAESYCDAGNHPRVVIRPSLLNSPLPSRVPSLSLRGAQRRGNLAG